MGLLIKIGGIIMPLIKCPECGKEVSDRAAACIHCGCPLQQKNIWDNKWNNIWCVVI